MSHIFISYRRQDAGHATGRINDRLRSEYGEDAAFMDVDNIPVGVDFRVHLDEQVCKCDVLLAVIGKKWLTIKKKKQRRIDNPTDFLRIEIESALNRDIPIVPVLVHGAEMPEAEDLPNSIRDLAYRNAVTIRNDPDFHTDMDRLIAGVNKHLQELEEKKRRGAEKATEAERKKAADVKRKAEREEAAVDAKHNAEQIERQKAGAEAKRAAENQNKAEKTDKAINTDGETPLMIAARSGPLKEVKRLVELGGNPSKVDTWGETVRQKAMRNSDKRVLQFIESILGVDRTAERAADAKREAENQNKAEKTDKVINTDGETPLMIAARSGTLKEVKRLVELGGNPSKVDRWGETVRQKAMRNSDKRVLQFIESL